MGDSGTGKSALIRQFLGHLEVRGDTAIVYDPALEYTPQFYTPERGDVILNPIDARSPYWSPGDELRHEAEALTLATSLFPDRVNENPFFTKAHDESLRICSRSDRPRRNWPRGSVTMRSSIVVSTGRRTRRLSTDRRPHSAAECSPRSTWSPIR